MGTALEAYTAKDEGLSNVYKDLKEAVLEKFDISPENLPSKRQSCIDAIGLVTNGDVDGFDDGFDRRGRQDEIGEVVILEQLLQVFPNDTRTWVREHEPKDGLMATMLALPNLM